MSSIENLVELVDNLALPLSSDDILTEFWHAVLQIYRTWEDKIAPTYRKNTLRNVCFREMNAISDVYKNNMGSASSRRVDFSNVFTQWAYMYVFMARHAHLVYNALSSSPDKTRLILSDDNQQMKSVCAIGGGPATDIIGQTMAFQELGIATLFAKEAYVLDLNVHWEKSWKSLYRNLPFKLQMCLPEVKYRHFDFKENLLTPTQKAIIREAQLVTMIKSLSPVAAYLNALPKELNEDGSITRWHSLYEILKCVSPGHSVLYIDNVTGSQRKLLMDAVDVLDYEIIIDRRMTVKLPRRIVSPTLSEEMHEYEPCRKAGCNEMILLQKNSG